LVLLEVAKAVQLSGTEAGAIYVIDEQQREFRLRATYGMDRDLIDARSRTRIWHQRTKYRADANGARCYPSSRLAK
jgi:hypothetical protein